MPGIGCRLLLSDEDVAWIADHEPEVLAVMDEMLDAAPLRRNRPQPAVQPLTR